MTSFKDLCINIKSSNPFMDDGFRWCRLKDGYIECAYIDKLNECPNFKPVRELLRELK